MRTIEWKEDSIYIIDQTKIPEHYEVKCLNTV